jgi:hypothetical protein
MNDRIGSNCLCFNIIIKKFLVVCYIFCCCLLNIWVSFWIRVVPVCWTPFVLRTLCTTRIQQVVQTFNKQQHKNTFESEDTTYSKKILVAIFKYQQF